MRTKARLILAIAATLLWVVLGLWILRRLALTEPFDLRTVLAYVILGLVGAEILRFGQQSRKT